MRATFGFLFSVFCVFYNPIDSGAIQLNSDIIEGVLAENNFVFINFYADWCRFSNMLSPVWDEAADKIREKFAGSVTKVYVGKVDCDSQGGLGTKFHVTKYPTIKYIVNGVPAKREYRGPRTADSLLDFVVKQTKDPVAEFASLEALATIDSKKRHVIGYFDSKSSPEAVEFGNIALNLKDDCEFHAGYGEAVSSMHPPGQSIVSFRPNTAMSSESDETYTGTLSDRSAFLAWVTEKCTPLIREITFENAEELTEEGVPFLILFHDPAETDSVKKFENVVRTQLTEDKGKVTFVTADGVKFAHPLEHLGKSKADLPVIAVDSFRHMYVFPKFDDIDVQGKLAGFLQDLYSGKLHREFHYGPDDPQIEEQSDEDGSSQTPPVTKSSPPKSQFKHLGPSRNRYTLMRDEF